MVIITSHAPGWLQTVTCTLSTTLLKDGKTISAAPLKRYVANCVQRCFQFCGWLSFRVLVLWPLIRWRMLNIMAQLFYEMKWATWYMVNGDGFCTCGALLSIFCRKLSVTCGGFLAPEVILHTTLAMHTGMPRMKWTLQCSFLVSVPLTRPYLSTRRLMLDTYQHTLV